ncbi:hypothetical protein OSB04_010627 [Centaurea solstitialis]|uniref:TIR domain-containing protein n=1 Tax=Centaurea solstitialis TaxID=347529 RepID=A0AA38TSQ8_9ASTR|nr:hypothetical protein OSB04_010627 [Centaurea solstitialis]
MWWDLTSHPSIFTSGHTSSSISLLQPFRGIDIKQTKHSMASSSLSWKYDVFLSFRGADTRNTIVDRLYSALTFKDDEELPRGETIHPSLLKAIEDSQTAVIVFSKNYVNSSWCLQELEHIMKCKDERGQIFENRKGNLSGEAFAQYEAEKKNVESWRKALFDAGNLSGLVAEGEHLLINFVYPMSRSETKFIKEIESTISKRLCVAIPSDDEDLVGMHDRLQALKSMLANDSQGVRTVGIWGLGGGGKTTLAYAIYDEISGTFDGCCFLKNVREESSKHGLEELQKEIVSRVLKQKKEDLHGDIRMLIKSRLSRKKVLLVLDDVDDAEQLEALAGSHNWFKEGCRIIITTRDQHLLPTSEVNVIYEIDLLNNDEAMKLFCKHALRCGNHIEDFYGLSNEVVSYAGGLPLALKVSALARLRDTPDGKIQEQLKISYDGLEPLVKELFLDIACFFRRKIDDDEPWVILEACGLHPKIGVRTLIEKALITVSKEGWFDMHDLIQEMAHYIVRGKNPRNPEKHSRVWRSEDLKKICAIPTEASTKNHCIEALQVWSSMLKDLDNLPCAIANMKELRWLSYEIFPATSLSRNFQPTKLSYLQLQLSSLRQLWEGDKILPNLKVLDLSQSQNLISTPDFQGLPCLERIRLNNCQKLTHVHPSISYHETLISVEMLGCTGLEMFPPISEMKKLETLKLSRCLRLCNFPEIQMNMENMVELRLSGTGIKVVPSSIGQYCTNLVSLHLRLSKSLESIEVNFHLLKHLKVLKLDLCEKLKLLEQGLLDANYQVLDLGITSFKDLQPGMKFLGFSPSLRKLSLRFCHLKNGDISSVLCELSNLHELDLSGNDFSQLHCSLLKLGSLKFLNLSDCKNLVELPDLPESIAVLEAWRCDKLEIVDLPTNLKWLWRISLPMRSISGDIGKKVQSMLQGNATKDYSISLCLKAYDTSIRDIRRTLMLELSPNSYNKFSGLLICIDVYGVWGTRNSVITIKDMMGTENEDVLEVSDGTLGDPWTGICYLYIYPSSKHTTILFSVDRRTNLKVELVHGSSKGDSMERVKDTTNSLEFWNTEPIKIVRDSKSCIEIQLGAS